MILDFYKFYSAGNTGDRAGSDCSGGKGIFAVSNGSVDNIVSGWDHSAVNVTEQLRKSVIGALSGGSGNISPRAAVAALALNENKAVWISAGDARVFFLHDREFYFCAEKTSRNASGDNAGSVSAPEMFSYDTPLKTGDAFLICTGGANEYLRDDEILVDMLKSGSAAGWAELLLLRIVERMGGGNDDLSLLTVRVK